jgi:phage terminase Nu1 subunit (DNA packaging protein)
MPPPWLALSFHVRFLAHRCLDLARRHVRDWLTLCLTRESGSARRRVSCSIKSASAVEGLSRGGPSGSPTRFPDRAGHVGPRQKTHLKIFDGGSAATFKRPLDGLNSSQEWNRNMSSLPKSATAAELALLWACSDRMVRQLAERGIAVKCGRGQYDLEQSSRNYVESLRAAAAGRASEAMTPQQRLKTAQAELAEIELAKQRKQWLPVADATEVWRSIIHGVRQRVLALPGKIAFEVPTLSRHDQGVIERIVRDDLDDAAMARGFIMDEAATDRCDACGTPLLKPATNEKEDTNANDKSQTGR